MSVAKTFYKFEGHNPFSDNQSRNFSDDKVSKEFYPVSAFWSLFNDQHEILIGSRGSGKTFLLKMMRYSMLKRINSNDAQKIVQEKKFLSLYVPMHLEFIGPIVEQKLGASRKQQLFLIAFNCMLAETLLREIGALLEDYPEKEQIEKTIKISAYLRNTWFNDSQQVSRMDLNSIISDIDSLFYSIDSNVDIELIPLAFRRQMCAPLLAVKNEIETVLGLTNDPTWIICIDEAEFLDEDIQKLINSVFRSDSNKIAIKMATLPYKHTTLETINPGIYVSNGNDFSYKVIDLNCNSTDFIGLTNKLCSHRIKTRISGDIPIETLEDFVGKQGNDDLIDYYKLDVSEETSSYEAIMRGIQSNLSEKRSAHSSNYSNPRKTIYDKYAPIFFVREIYKKSKEGNYKPSWFAGAANIRKVSQGNPRIFIKLMYDLFELARKRSNFSTKTQHEVLNRFAISACKETRSLGPTGPVINDNLNKISGRIHDKVHGNPMVAVGSTFKFGNDALVKTNELWIKEAIAHSKIIVSDDEMLDFDLITKSTTFLLANIWAVAYWLPMRKDNPIIVNETDNNQLGQKTQQLSLFDKEYL